MYNANQGGGSNQGYNQGQGWNQGPPPQGGWNQGQQGGYNQGPPGGPQGGYNQGQQGGWNQGPQGGYNQGPQGAPQGGYNQGPQGGAPGGYNQGPQGGAPGGYNQGQQGGYNQGQQGGWNQGQQGGYNQGQQGGWNQGPPGGPQGYNQGPQGYNQGPQGGPQGGYTQGPGGYNQGHQQGGYNQGPAGHQGPPVFGSQFVSYYPAPGGHPPYDPYQDSQALIKAMKGFGTDEKALIAVLTRVLNYQVDPLKAKFEANYGKSLVRAIEKETSGDLEFGLCCLARGPFELDAFLVHEAVDGLGTKELWLNDILLGRSNTELAALKQAYNRIYSRSLDRDVVGDLSLKTKQLFEIVLAMNKEDDRVFLNQPPAQQEQRVQLDTLELYRATEGKVGTDEIMVCSILATRSDAQIRAISTSFYKMYHKTLAGTLKSEFSGHMEDALVYMVQSASDKPSLYASLLFEAMDGAGTKEESLVQRLVRYHWIPGMMPAVNNAYKTLYKRNLSSEIKNETSRDFENLLVALANSR